MKRIWILVIALVIVVGGGAYYFYHQSQTASANQTTSIKLVQITTGDITNTIDVTGTVRSAQTSTLSWQTNGRVDTVDVTIGQEVKEGDALAELASDSLDDDVTLATANLVSAKQALEDIQDSDSEASDAYQALIDAQDTYDTAKVAYDKATKGRASAETLEAAEAAYLNAQAMVDMADRAYSNTSNLSDSDSKRASALTALNSAIDARDTALATLNWYKGTDTEIELAQKKATLMVAEAALEDAERKYERVKDGPTEDEIAAAQAKIDSYQAIIDTASLTAPFDGTVTAVDTEVGDLISDGDTAFQIDDLTHMYIDVSVAETDINSVEVGQEATITMDAIEDTTYHGTVTKVSKIAGASSSGSVTYDVTLEITDPDEHVRTGMTAAASIINAQATNVLMVPNKAVTTSGDKKYVTIQSNGFEKQVEVTAGLKGETYTEVSGDAISEGDTVVITYNLAVTTSDTSSSTDQNSSNLLGGLTGSSMSGPGGGMP